jgi:hypothetical protein
MADLLISVVGSEERPVPERRSPDTGGKERRFTYQGLGDFPLHTRKAHVQPNAEEAGAVSQTQFDFGLYGQANRRTIVR